MAGAPRPGVWDCLGTALPVCKSGSTHTGNPSNYRPILLCKYSVIAPSQSGFRPGLFTKHADVTDVLTLVYDSIHDKKCSGLIYLDIQKAFDTVYYKLLIAKRINTMASEALQQISLNLTYIIDSNLLLWIMYQDYIQLIGEFSKS